ncbi:DUF2971 domain-containing protein [Plesiomonas shigelloides]|uniref:DUF2971 domain-containing protein n=1 Tax=Plesiomonas shigelloides TaxID=703 RepID=UPI0015B62760|nr:DUF2971 domain-containing protein [Plesiomonas shigelloides]
MKSLYKFITYRKGFFLSPQLRISQRSALNDPFECLPAAENIADIYDRIFNKFKESGSNIPNPNCIGDLVRKSENCMIHYSDLLDYYGVVSLTQSHDNILMWSHYSNQHTGIVIELDTQMIGLDNEITHSGVLSDNNKFPMSVLYSNTRYVNDDGGYTFGPLFDTYFVKSDDWSYEKEYRIVTKTTNASEVIIDNVVREKFKLSDYESFFDFIELPCGRFKAVLNSIADMPNENMTFGDNPVKMKRNIKFNSYNIFSKYGTSLFLYNLPKVAIKKVYFGCCISHEDKESILNELRLSKLAVEVVQMRRHQNRFELIETVDLS